MPFLTSHETPKIYYEVFNDKQNAYPVVFIHPIGGNIEIWNEEIKVAVKKGFRAIAYELRGHNRSELGSIAYTMHDLVNDLHVLLGELKVKRCTLVGHSIGGQISCNYAAKYPDRVDNLIIISSSSMIIPDRDLEKHHKTREIARTKGMEALAEETMKEDGAAKKAFRDKKKRETFTRIFTKTSPEGFVAATVALYSIPDITEAMQRCSFGIYGIVGSEDKVFLRLMQEMQRQIPRFKMKVIEGFDHWLIIENHELFDRAFEEAL
jgi:pimeloyl-ACP methyl ester carboxylesterase